MNRPYFVASVLLLLPAISHADDGFRPEEPLCAYTVESNIATDLRNPYTVMEYVSSVTGDGRVFRGEPNQLDHYRSQVRPYLYPGAQLIDTDFCGLDFDGALAPQGGTLFLSSAKLWRARFYYADLTSADFSHAELNGAVFGRCNTAVSAECEGAANVSGANFRNADLRAADMSAMRAFETHFGGALFNNLTRLPLEWGDTEEERRRSAVRDYGMINEDSPPSLAEHTQHAVGELSSPPIPAGRGTNDDEDTAGDERSERAAGERRPGGGTQQAPSAE